MKLTQITLIAVLGLLCVSQAHAEIIRRPGPFTVPKAQFGCQNLMDYKEIRDHVTLKEPEIAARRLARHQTEAMELKDQACMNVPKGAVVTVKERWIAYECVMLKARPSNACFWIENVSGDKRTVNPDYPSSYY